MRRLRRAHQRQAKLQAKRHKRLKRRAVAAGTAAVITLGTAMSINKALADDHQLPVSQDADADLLANKEELAIGYRAFEPDQNRNEIPDGVELARRCAAVINLLPRNGLPGANGIYRICHEVDGLEQCDVCDEWIHMGGCVIINPKLGLQYPDPCDLLEPMFLPDLALHYMEHGSFDCFGHSEPNEPLHVGRVDIPRLLRVLELRFPYEPNEHQLPLDYVVVPYGQLAPDANDLDGDLLANSEELTAGYNLYNPDQDQDLTPDGIELAKQCAALISQLPFGPDPNEPNKPYIEHWQQFGIETCDICGATVNMGPASIVNPMLKVTVDCPLIAMHYMQHGSFSYAGDVHAARVDVPLLLKALEMPKRCGDLGTLYLPSDLNKDCKVDLTDFAQLGDDWLALTDPAQQ